MNLTYSQSFQNGGIYFGNPNDSNRQWISRAYIDDVFIVQPRLDSLQTIRAA